MGYFTSPGLDTRQIEKAFTFSVFTEIVKDMSHSSVTLTEHSRLRQSGIPVLDLVAELTVTDTVSQCHSVTLIVSDSVTTSSWQVLDSHWAYSTGQVPSHTFLLIGRV